MGRGRRGPATLSTPARPASTACAPPKDAAGAAAGVIADVEAEMRTELCRFLGIGSLDELPRRLARGEDPGRPPEDLLRAAAIAAALGLERELSDMVRAASVAYAAHAERFEQVIARPRTKADQQFLRSLGVSYRDEGEITARSTSNRKAVEALAEAAAGTLRHEELPRNVLRPARQVRHDDHRQLWRVQTVLAQRIHDALAGGDLELARGEIVDALCMLGNEDAARATRSAPEWSLEVASRLVRAARETGTAPPFGWTQGVAHLGQANLDRVGINRLAGDDAEACIVPGQPRGFHDLERADGVDTFEDQARRILRHPGRYHHSQGSSSDLRHKTVNVPVADADAFRKIASHYAGHPAFAGYGMVSALNLASRGKSEMSVAMRLVFADEDADQERREIWAVLKRGDSGARTTPGRARACGLGELGLSEADISFEVPWDRAPVSGYYAQNRKAAMVRALPARLDEVLTRPPRPCSHHRASWSPTEDGDALRLSCEDCDRMALAVVPRHRLPAGVRGVPSLGPLDEPRYLARQRFHAILAGRTETASSFAELRARDRVVEIRPNGFSGGHAGASRARSLQSAFSARR